MPNFELYKYNPDQYLPDELEKTFVARKSLLDEIINDLTARIDASTNQNFLIIGPRGIGKTNMLLMIQNRIKKDSKLSKSYIPLRTSEEEYYRNTRFSCQDGGQNHRLAWWRSTG